MLQGTPEECADAYAALEAVANREECKTAWDLFDSNSVSLNDANTIVTDYCATDCTADIEEALANTFAVCKEHLDTLQEHQLRVWAGFAKIPCLQAGDDNHYCLPVWKNLASVNINFNFTEELLDNTYCDVCVQGVFKLMSYYFPRDLLAHGALVDLICDRFNGQYSILAYQEFLRYSEANPNSESVPSAGYLDRACHPGVARFITRSFKLMTAVDPTSSEVDFVAVFYNVIKMMCEKDGGQYCMIKMFQGGQDMDVSEPCGEDGEINPDTTETCPAACKAALQTMKSRSGCCLGTMAEFVGSMMSIGGDADAVNPVVWAFEDWCQVPLPYSCSGTVLKVELIIHGVDPDWYAAEENAKEFTNILKDALVEDTGANNVRYLPNTGASKLQAAGDVTYTVEITTGDNGADIRNKVEAGDYAIPGVNSQVPLAAYADLAQPLTVTGSAEVLRMGAAASVTPAASVLVLLLAAVARFLF